MGRPANQPKRGDLPTALLFVGFCLVLMVAIGAIFYYMNQDNALLPEAKPGAPVQDKPFVK